MSTFLSQWPITAISCGRDHTVALLDGGTVFGWGGDGSGRMPPGTPQYCTSPPAGTGAVEVRTVGRIDGLAAGYGVTLAIAEHGRLCAWGANACGLAGRLDAINPATPQWLPLPAGVRDVAAGEFQYAAIDAAGRLLTWGLNTEGALGRPVRQHNAGPGHVEGIAPLVRVAVGRGHMLAIDVDGVLYAWGGNGAGQLGQGHLASVGSPQPVLAGRRRFVGVAAGASHSLALSSLGKLYAWGSNHHGQLGRRTPGYTSAPLPVPLPEPVEAIDAGMHFSVALGVSGTVYTWGWNGHGQLGTPADGDRHRPAAVADLPPARAIAAGETHVVALTAGGLHGWGGNASGQLGKAERRQSTGFRFF
jgi:alpha-tubulin suppressor-like RCC1 family protein